MEKVTQSYPLDTTQLLLSVLLERIVYYGVRGFLVIYFVSEYINLPEIEAIHLYGNFTSLFTFSIIGGALLGDFLLGNKNASVLGGIFMIIGLFILLIPNSTTIYLGGTLFFLGGGVYHNNILACVGRQLSATPKLLDGGFYIYYLSIIIGSFLGSLFLALLAESYSFQAAIIVAMLLNIGVVLLMKKVQIDKKTKPSTDSSPINYNIKPIGLLLFVMVLFSVFNEQVLFMKTDYFSMIKDNLPLYAKSAFSFSEQLFCLLFVILLSILWSYRYISSIKKMVVGFISLVVCGGLLYLFSVASPPHLFIFLMLILGLSEALFMPPTYSLLTKYLPHKYLATGFSVFQILNRKLAVMIGAFFI